MLFLQSYDLFFFGSVLVIFRPRIWPSFYRMDISDAVFVYLLSLLMDLLEI